VGKYQALDWEQVFVEGKTFCKTTSAKMPTEVAQKRLKQYQLSHNNQTSSIRLLISRKSWQRILFLSPASAVRNTTKAQLKSQQIYAFYKLRW
jgi:hypothetical protein